MPEEILLPEQLSIDIPAPANPAEPSGNRQMIPNRQSTTAMPQAEHERCKPRVIIWQVTPSAMPEGNTPGRKEPHNAGILTLNECLLTIDSIARFAKPIIVFAGDNPAARPDLHDIVAYATALGVKSIIELRPGDITDDVIQRFREFGPRIFRVIIDGCIIEDMETRYRQTPEFASLEDSIRRLRHAGFEIHFSLTISSPDSRALAYNLDYAFRQAASGLYCHLSFPKRTKTRHNGRLESDLDTFISEISDMKPLLPGEMYFSPQCVKFGAYHAAEPAVNETEHHNSHLRWMQWCVAGKSFAFISDTGDVRPCSRSGRSCGNLRSAGYNFHSIWSDSPVFQALREHRWSCAEARQHIAQKLPVRSSQHPEDCNESKE